MDIRPVKKRRQKTVRRMRRPSNAVQPSGQKNITVRSKLMPLNQQNIRLKNNGSKGRDFLKRNFLAAAIFVFLCGLYLPASGLINSAGQYQELINQSLPFNAILNDASYMPQKIFLMLAHPNELSSDFILKIFTFIFTVFVVYLFYRACLNWFGKTTAIITAFLFSTSSWMILSSQSLSFSNIYLAFIPLVIYLNYLLTRDKNGLRIFFATLLFSITLYSPGMVWPILGLIVLLPVFMQKILAKYNLGNIWILIAFTVVMILPLFASLAFRPSNFSYILVGDNQTSIHAFLQNLQVSLDAMFLNGIPDSDLWLVGTPVFSYLTSLLFVFGLIFLFVSKGFRQHFNFLAISLAFAILTVSFVGLPALSLTVPVVYLVTGFGIKFLLGSWYVIFPSNPVARNLGLTFIIFIALLSSGYDITRFYIARPEASSRLSVLSSEKVT